MQTRNMNKEFIPYEQALALKELGFDEPCLGRYWHEEFKLINIDKQFEVPHYACSAPLYQQAFRWFREKYNLYQDISAFAWNYDKKQLGFSIRTYLNPVNIETERKVYGEVYETYEEAELECLKELIEIVKNG